MSTLPDRVLESDRLVLRRITEDDALFLLELLNDEAFLRFIGDRGVRTEDDARAYARNGPIASYQRHGFGLLLTALKDDNTPIGICGLLKRDTLEDVDVGFAFLPAFRTRGYAFEAVTAVLSYARGTLGLSRVVAIVNADNERSRKLLMRAGLQFERLVQQESDGPSVELFG
ncbi:MAG: GNAT family N-acetyltransferase [bacterium]